MIAKGIKSAASHGVVANRTPFAIGRTIVNISCQAIDKCALHS